MNNLLLGECKTGYLQLKEVASYFDSHLDDGSASVSVMDDQVLASSYLMIAAWQVGAVGEALARARSALERASTLGHLGTTVNHYFQRAILFAELGDSKVLIAEAERYLELAEQSGIPYFLPLSRMYHTYASGLIREPSSAAAELRVRLDEYVRAGARLLAPGMYGLLAELEMLANEWGNVRSTIEEGLKLVEQGCDLYSAPYLYRLLGLFHARSEVSDLVEAHRALRTSIDIASSQGARSKLLLSALAFARLPRQSPESLLEAQNILKSAFEGFENQTEFPAVAEAKSLLDDLNNLPELRAARERERQIAEIRSNYRRAVAWGAGQWSERAAAAFDSADNDISSAAQQGAAHYSEVFILMARYWGVGNLQAATVLGENALRQLKDRGAIRWAHSMGRMVAMNHVLRGEFPAAYTQLKEVVAYFDSALDDGSAPLGVMDDQAAASSYLMFVAWHVGAVSEALAHGRSALARASALGHLGTLVNYRLYVVLIGTRSGDRESLLREAVHFLELTERSGIPYYLPAARMYHTYASGLIREPSSAAANLRAQLAEYMHAGARLHAPSMYGCIAELEMLANEWSNVETTIEAGINLVEHGCDLYVAPSLYRLLGTFHSRRPDAPDPSEARRGLRMSIDIASAQGARSERLLSALELARMPNQSPDSFSEARNILVSALLELESETEFPAVAEAKSLLVRIEDVLVSAPRGRA